jgi:hypothetical protein
MLFFGSAVASRPLFCFCFLSSVLRAKPFSFGFITFFVTCLSVLYHPGKQSDTPWWVGVSEAKKGPGSIIFPLLETPRNTRNKNGGKTDIEVFIDSSNMLFFNDIKKKTWVIA